MAVLMKPASGGLQNTALSWLFIDSCHRGWNCFCLVTFQDAGVNN
jgi:hypothetical protein